MSVTGRRRGRPGQRQPQPIQSLAKALAIVDRLAKADMPIGVTEVARDVGIPKATAHRLLTTLLGADAVAYDPASQRYSLGSSIIRNGLLGLRRLELHRAARPLLEYLQQETGETAVLAARQGVKKVFLDQVESDQELRRTLPLGEVLELYQGSGGRSMLAYLPPDELEQYLAGGPFKRLSVATISDPEELRAELAKIRRAGYAVSRGEQSTSMGSPIFGPDQAIVGALVLSGPSYRMQAQKIQRYAKILIRAADQVSAGLGYTPKAA